MDPFDGGDPNPDEDGGGDAPSPRGRSRVITANPTIIKEAETVHVAAFPDAIQLRSWKASVRTEVTAAAGPGRSDAAFKWVQQTDDMSCSALGEPDELESLDTKLASGGGMSRLRSKQWLNQDSV